jgi:MoxR-like ATPase
MYKSKLDEARRRMGSQIVGNDEAILLTFAAWICGKAMLLTSMRGRGKTMMALAFRKVLKDAIGARLQCTPETMPGNILGREIYDELLKKFEVRLSKIMLSDVALIDEINRALEEAQAAFMELFEEWQATIGPETFELAKHMLIIATRNPDGQAGTGRLGDAFRDRFILDVDMKFPPRQEMIDLLGNTAIHRGDADIEWTLEKNDILLFHAHNDWMTETAPAAVKGYVTDLVTCLQVDEPEFENLLLGDSLKAKKLAADSLWKEADKKRLKDFIGSKVIDLEILEDGVSPRAAIWILHAACAVAFLDGRDEVTFDDVRTVFIASCRHKLILRSTAKAYGIRAEDILKSVLDSVKY